MVKNTIGTELAGGFKLTASALSVWINNAGRVGESTVAPGDQNDGSPLHIAALKSACVMARVPELVAHSILEHNRDLLSEAAQKLALASFGLTKIDAPREFDLTMPAVTVRCIGGSRHGMPLRWMLHQSFLITEKVKDNPLASTGSLSGLPVERYYLRFGQLDDATLWFAVHASKLADFDRLLPIAQSYGDLAMAFALPDAILELTPLA